MCFTFPSTASTQCSASSKKHPRKTQNVTHPGPTGSGRQHNNPFTKHVPGYLPLTHTLPQEMHVEKLPALGLTSGMCTGGRTECFPSETDLCPPQVKPTS